jgi:hypothetical protein
MNQAITIGAITRRLSVTTGRPLSFMSTSIGTTTVGAITTTMIVMTTEALYQLV